jgi:hypothetical protein
MRAYAVQAKKKQLEIDAAEIRLRAEYQLGKMIDAQKRGIGLNRGAAGSRVSGTKRVPLKDARPTLAAAGIDKKLSASSQKLAAVPEPTFIAMLAGWRERVQRDGERITIDLLRERPRRGPTIGSRAVSGAGPSWFPDRPYYDDGLSTLFHADSRHVLAPPSALVVGDPPFKSSPITASIASDHWPMYSGASPFI